MRSHFETCHCPLDCILIKFVVSKAVSTVSDQGGLSEDDTAAPQEFLDTCTPLPNPEKKQGKHLWRDNPWSQAKERGCREFQKAVHVLVQAEGVPPIE